MRAYLLQACDSVILTDVVFIFPPYLMSVTWLFYLRHFLGNVTVANSFNLECVAYAISECVAGSPTCPDSTCPLWTNGSQPYKCHLKFRLMFSYTFLRRILVNIWFMKKHHGSFLSSLFLFCLSILKFLIAAHGNFMTKESQIAGSPIAVQKL